MDEGREESNWKMTKWILASMVFCRTEEAQKQSLDPEAWNIPERERKLAVHEFERQRKKQEMAEAANDPVKLAAIRAARIAEFNRFRAQFRS